MTRPSHPSSHREDGFTLIELIVVVVVIGVLAGIAIPSYLGQQRSARDATVVADVRNTSTMVDAWVIENSRTALPNTTEYVRSGGKIVQSGSTVINVTTNGSGAYTVCGYTAGGGNYGSNASAFLIDTAANRSGRTTTGCPGDGVTATPSSTPSPSTSTGGSTGGTSTGGSGSGSTPTASASPTPSAAPSITPTPTPTPSATSVTWVDCGGENDYCFFSGTKVVRYGLAPSSYVTKTLTGGTPCSNDVFGDPAYGYYKTCSYQQ